MKPNPEVLTTDRHTEHCLAADIPLPRLSDDAVVHIHDFIHHVLDLFEARYGDQIHRFYADLFDDSFIDSGSSLDPDDPPF
jgi:hypothetical protein